MARRKRKNDDGTRGALVLLMVLLVIAVVGVMGYTGKVYVDQKGNDNSTTNAQSSTAATTTNTTQQQEDKKDDKTNTEPVEEPKKEEPEEKTTEESQKEEVKVSDEDKAIDLAKKQYGTTNGVYFRIEQIKSNSVYIVSVRDNETTRDLAWYTIDVVNGTVK